MYQYASDVKDVLLNSHNVVEVHDFVKDVLRTAITTDSSGEYRIVKWPVPAEISPGGTALISQCSGSQLHQLLDLDSAWDGPISLAVFVESSHSLSVVTNYLLEVQSCLPDALTEVIIQLVMPLTSSSADCCTKLSNVTCSNFLSVFDKHWSGVRNYEGKLDYPNNLLRNLAIEATVSDHIFVVDIDMIPSLGLFSQFHEFIRRQPTDRKVAYVVPVFEVQLELEIPKDRSALLRMWDHGIVRPFYRTMCWKCQRYTDYERWRNLTLKHSEQVDIAYTVEWHDPWEPFYIVEHSAPRYSEQFKNYGFNRISQVCLISAFDNSWCS